MESTDSDEQMDVSSVYFNQLGLQHSLDYSHILITKIHLI